MRRTILVWGCLAAALLLPVAIAATSPLLAWRQPVYIVAGFAGVIGLSLLLVQPLLAGRYLPKLSPSAARRLHAIAGGGIVAAVLVHVGGLWLTSPPDVIDVLLLRSPTPFSIWGVMSMWAIFATAIVAALYRRRNLQALTWRRLHLALGVIIAASTALHAVLIEGTMGTVSKWMLCALVLAATGRLVADRWPQVTGRRPRNVSDRGPDAPSGR